MALDPLIIGIVPSLIWLALFLFEDRRHPEPRRMIFYVFLAGGFATAVAAIPELYIQRLFSISGELASSLSFLFSFAFIEEVAKFAAVYIVVRRSRFFDEWVDGMVYMVTAALGFAAIENMLNLMGTSLIAEVALVRGMGATLLHALASGIVGFYWMRKRPLEGLFFATIIHGLFNFLILQFGGVQVYPFLLLSLAAVFTFHDFELLKRRDALRMIKRPTFRR